MTYLEWVDIVLAAAVRHTETDGNYGLVGVHGHMLGSELSVPADDVGRLALNSAGQDLEAMGLADNQYAMFRSNTNGKKIVRAGGLRSQWPGLFRQVKPLPEDLEVLRRIIEASEVRAETFADAKLVELKDVLQGMGVDASQGSAIAIAHRLHDDHCIGKPLITTGWCQVRPSYIGFVIATQREISGQESLVRELVEEWETTGADFKELLHLDTDRQKAEFCKDVLALANTESSLVDRGRTVSRVLSE